MVWLQLLVLLLLLIRLLVKLLLLMLLLLPSVLVIASAASGVLVWMRRTIHHATVRTVMADGCMVQVVIVRMAGAGAAVRVLQLLEVLARVPNVDQRCLGRYRRIRHHHHHVRVARERVDKRRKHAVAHLHRRELGTELRAGQLELFDDVGHLLEPVAVPVLFALAVRNHQKGGPLEQQHLVRVHHVREVVERVLQRLHVRDQLVDDAAPRPVQRLVPDARPECRTLERARTALQVLLALLEYYVALLLRHQVHLVHEAEDLRVRRVDQQRLQARLVVVHVLVQLAALHIEHVDQHLHVPEDVVLL